MPSNNAAWQNKVGDKPVVHDAPYPTPGGNELVIKAHAWAINPVDWVLQSQPWFPWLEFPLILGNDVAGEVVEVGASVAAHQFKIGDRVLALALGSGVNVPAQGGFQEYVVVLPVVASRIPESVSFAQAAVFPLALATAACGLFERGFLALDLPSVVARTRRQDTGKGKVVLVWGGSSAVGSNAIQLACAAGYAVFASSSEANFGYLKKLGATRVFDYKSETVVQDVASAVEKKALAGIFQAAGSVEVGLEIAKATKSFLSSALPIPEDKVPDGVKAKMVFASTLKDNEVGPAIFGDFLPKALAEGSYQVAPEPWVIGKGLESLQEGLEAQQKGVSAKKIVVTI